MVRRRGGRGMKKSSREKKTPKKELCVFRQGQKCVLVAKQQEAMPVKTYREHLKVMVGKH
jgi:hypothetical protein